MCIYLIKCRFDLNENLLSKKVIAMPITHEFFKSLQQNLTLYYHEQTFNIRVGSVGIR